MRSMLRRTTLCVLLAFSGAAFAQDAADAPASAEPAAPVAATAATSATGKVGAPEAGKAQIVFFRPSKFTGAAIGFKVREGDTIAIDFSADGVAVELNGEARGKVAGAGFARALLKVWLGEKPVDASLKKALLGA